MKVAKKSPSHPLIVFLKFLGSNCSEKNPFSTLVVEGQALVHIDIHFRIHWSLIKHFIKTIYQISDPVGPRVSAGIFFIIMEQKRKNTFQRCDNPRFDIILISPIRVFLWIIWKIECVVVLGGWYLKYFHCKMINKATSHTICPVRLMPISEGGILDQNPLHCTVG